MGREKLPITVRRLLSSLVIIVSFLMVPRFSSETEEFIKPLVIPSM